MRDRHPASGGGPATAGGSPLLVVFTTVFIDLIGFGIIIPLTSLYGRHFGANGVQLGVLGASYSLMQFFFAPIWGRLSDRVGRRPILLLSLAGSTLSYIGFGLAPNYICLLATRVFAGIFAANVSTAQAYVADITTPENRARGMGLIGAAFGIGFILGPPLGGISAAKLGLKAPGLLAGAICGANLLLAFVRLPESLPRERRVSAAPRARTPLDLERLGAAFRHPYLWLLLAMFFLLTFAFSNVEQTFALLFEKKFSLDTREAGLKTGLILMWVGVVGAIVQGGLINRLVHRFGERKLLIVGIFLFASTIAILPYGPSYRAYYLMMIPLALGSGLVNPSLSSLISRSASATEQGSTLGISQGLGSLARATGPFLGLLTFTLRPSLPYTIASLIGVLVLGGSLWLARITRGMSLDAPSTG